MTRSEDPMPSRCGLALILMVFSGVPAGAHFNMLLPQAASVKRGEAVMVVYQWGHPFEHQLFDAPTPQSVIAIAPDGKKTDLGKLLEPLTLPLPEGKKVQALRFRFTPEQRGDHLLILTTPPIW